MALGYDTRVVFQEKRWSFVWMKLLCRVPLALVSRALRALKRQS
jgi:hypothetical protein